MSSSPSGNPDTFALSPLLALLPSVGDVGKLEGLASALFVHFETVEGARHSTRSAEQGAQVTAHAAMLRLVLEWLSEQRGEGSIDE